MGAHFVGHVKCFVGAMGVRVRVNLHVQHFDLMLGLVILDLGLRFTMEVT